MTHPTPAILNFNLIISEIKKTVMCGTPPFTLLLFFHQFYSNSSCMERFKGPVTTLLSPITTASFLPPSIPHCHPHPHTQIS